MRGWLAASGILSLSTDITSSSTSEPESGGRGGEGRGGEGRGGGEAVYIQYMYATQHSLAEKVWPARLSQHEYYRVRTK